MGQYLSTARLEIYPWSANRARVSFRSVNRIGQAGYQAGLQRHHLIPRQFLAEAVFGRLFASIGTKELAFDDFRVNGLLLPGSESAAIRMGAPLHRGPHRRYSSLVSERLGQIEAEWSYQNRSNSEKARTDALMRLRLLQRALRRRLLTGSNRLTLNRHDPLGKGKDFAELDSLVDRLWEATATPAPVSGS